MRGLRERLVNAGMHGGRVNGGDGASDRSPEAGADGDSVRYPARGVNYSGE
ncbi:MAG: hypothetical protein JWO42_2590 [Chloroflexi bacterium]|nr:hypothetical protein [Chloroflexota bacterium]